MSLLDKIKNGIRSINDVLKQVDKPGFSDKANGVEQIEKTRLAKGEDFVEVTAGKPIVPQYTVNEKQAEKQAEKAAAAKAKGRKPKQNVLGEV